MNSPTQRTLALLRKDGWTCAIVERWNPHARIRQDLYGFIDIVAIHPDRGILGVQACAGASHAARRTKIIQEPRAWLWRKAGGMIDVCSWSKKGAAGKRKMWEARIEHIALGDLEVPAVVTDQEMPCSTPPAPSSAALPERA